MRTVLLAIFNTLPECLDVLAVAVFFNIIFAVVGVQQFGGRFGSCMGVIVHAPNATLYNYNDTNTSSSSHPFTLSPTAALACTAGDAAAGGAALVRQTESYTLNRTACESHGHLWVNPNLGNFDNTVSGMLVLFEMLTAEVRC